MTNQYEIVEFIVNNREGLIKEITPSVLSYLDKSQKAKDAFKASYNNYFNRFILNLIKDQIYDIFSNRITYEEMEIILDQDVLSQINFDELFCKKEFYETSK